MSHVTHMYESCHTYEGVMSDWVVCRVCVVNVTVSSCFEIFSGTADHCATHRLLLCTALMLRTPLSFLQPRTTYTCDILIYI